MWDFLLPCVSRTTGQLGGNREKGKYDEVKECMHGKGGVKLSPLICNCNNWDEFGCQDSMVRLNAYSQRFVCWRDLILEGEGRRALQQRARTLTCYPSTALLYKRLYQEARDNSAWKNNETIKEKCHTQCIRFSLQIQIRRCSKK